MFNYLGYYSIKEEISNVQLYRQEKDITLTGGAAPVYLYRISIDNEGDINAAAVFFDEMQKQNKNVVMLKIEKS